MLSRFYAYSIGHEIHKTGLTSSNNEILIAWLINYATQNENITTKNYLK